MLKTDNCVGHQVIQSSVINYQCPCKCPAENWFVF